MRFMADENLPALVVSLLRDAGHDVAWAAEDMASAPDSDVLARAMREDRVVITCDKSDYGRLIYQDGHPGQCGVVLLRFRDAQMSDQPQFIANVVGNEAVDWRGSFTSIRTGPVPGPRIPSQAV